MRTSFLLVLAVIISACRDINITVPTGNSLPPAGVEQVFLGAHKDSLKVADTMTVVARAVPTWTDPNFNHRVTWRSADSTIASLVSTTDSTVRITGRKAGSVQIRGYSAVDTTKYATFTITVYAGTITSSTGSVVSLLAFGGTSAPDTLKVSLSRQVPMPRVDINTSSGTRTLADSEKSQYIFFSSTNALVLSVDAATGVMTAHAVGQAQIFATAKSDPNYKAFYPRVIVVVP